MLRPFDIYLNAKDDIHFIIIIANFALSLEAVFFSFVICDPALKNKMAFHKNGDFTKHCQIVLLTTP